MEKSLGERLQTCRFTPQRLSLLEKALFELRSTLNKQVDPLVEYLVQGIKQLNGNVHIQAMAQATGSSIRQLERKFRNEVGLTLKEYASVVRFCHTKEIIRQFPNRDLLDIALETGYYDHSHMTHAFKRIAGSSPSHFR